MTFSKFYFKLVSICNLIRVSQPPTRRSGISTKWNFNYDFFSFFEHSCILESRRYVNFWRAYRQQKADYLSIHLIKKEKSLYIRYISNLFDRTKINFFNLIIHKQLNNIFKTKTLYDHKLIDDIKVRRLITLPFLTFNQQVCPRWPWPCPGRGLDTVFIRVLPEDIVYHQNIRIALFRHFIFIAVGQFSWPLEPVKGWINN